MATLKTIKENPPSSYLTKLAVIESNNNPNAKAKTSSASGAYQFLESTWRGLNDKYKLGYNLNDRFDPIKSKKVADLLTKENENALRPVLGRELNDGERYLGHFLGTQGSKELLSVYLKNPNEKVGAVVSGGALKANKSIFLNKDGSQKTVGDVYNWAGKKMNIKPTYANSVAPYKNQSQETVTPTLNYFGIQKETPIFASVPDSEEKEDITEKVEEGVASKDIVEVEQKTKEYNFLEELQKEDYSHLQPQQVAQQQTVPQVDFMQQYEQVSQFIDNTLAQQGGEYSENELSFLSEIGIPISPNGLYDYPNQKVVVPTKDGRITMKNINYEVLGTDEYGNKKIMKPNGEYQYKGKTITEIPLFKK